MNDIIAVAVSGGPDSMALLHATYRTTKNIVAITFDHRLREESKTEAENIGVFCKTLGIEHVILMPDTPISKTNVMMNARDARYRAISAYCKEHGIASVLVGHHLDDQLETWFMNLSRGAGANGLAGMSCVSKIYDMEIVRPLLSTEKSALIRYCDNNGIPYIIDPSNTNLDRKRARFRNKMDDILQLLEINKQTVLSTMDKLSMVNDLVTATTESLQHLISRSKYGYAIIDVKDWKDISEAVRLQLISDAFKYVTAQPYKHRIDKLRRIDDSILRQDRKWTTLANCKIQIKRSTVTIAPVNKNKVAGYNIGTGHTDMADIADVPKWVQQRLPAYTLSNNTWTYEPYVKWSME